MPVKYNLVARGDPCADPHEGSMDADPGIEEQLTHAEHYLEQAYLKEDEGAYKEALDACVAAIEIMQPVLAEAYNLRGIILEELGHDQEAIESYEKSLRIEPGLHEAADNLMALESELGIQHRLVTIAAFSYPTEAHIAKSRLEAEGIWSFVADERTTTANWLYSNAIGGVKLQVRDADVERAIETLGIEPSDELDDLEIDGDEQDESTCPSCHSTNIHYERFAMRPLFATWLLFGVPLPFLKRKWKCGACGYEWRWNELPEHINDE